MRLRCTSRPGEGFICFAPEDGCGFGCGFGSALGPTLGPTPVPALGPTLGATLGPTLGLALGRTLGHTLGRTLGFGLVSTFLFQLYFSSDLLLKVIALYLKTRGGFTEPRAGGASMSVTAGDVKVSIDLDRLRNQAAEQSNLLDGISDT